MQVDDIKFIVDYFIYAKPDFLSGMGVDVSKLPARDEWITILRKELRVEDRKKMFYYIVWEMDDEPIGHSNINKITFDQEAYIHLHMWKEKKRQKGIGLQFVKMTLPYYFSKFRLKNLFCEPYTLNPAPNKTLIKAGFEFIEEYETIPGWINFHQKVNRYVMTKERFEATNN